MTVKDKEEEQKANSPLPWRLDIDPSSERSFAPVIDRVTLLPADSYFTRNSESVQ